MKIIFNLTQGPDHYEVRSNGERLQLYRNDVHHSQWDPTQPLYGCVWDLMTLPALYRPKKSIKNALLLGFGAGAVALKLQKLVKPEKIVGVELDLVHLDIAKNIFKSSVGCELFKADANKWVQDEVSKPEFPAFDLIIDDLYRDVNNRSVPLSLEWYKSLAKLANPDCTIVFNTTNPGEEIPQFEPFLEDSLLHERFSHSKVFRRHASLNAIVAFSSVPFEEMTLNKRLTEILSHYPKCTVTIDDYLISDIDGS